MGKCTFQFRILLSYAFIYVSVRIFVQPNSFVYPPNILQWSYNQIVKDKLVRLLLPGLVFSIIATILKIIQNYAEIILQ